MNNTKYNQNLIKNQKKSMLGSNCAGQLHSISREKSYLLDNQPLGRGTTTLSPPHMIIEILYIKYFPPLKSDPLCS